MSTVEIKNVGPVEHLALPVPEGGGIVVLHGRNGAGKTKTLEAVEKLASGRGQVSVRDGAMKGAVTGFGATLTVARSTTRQGTLAVESLDGRLSVADLVQPPVKDPAAADAKRIKTLVSLAGEKPDPALFHAIAGGPAAFAEVIPLAEADDMVTLAAKIKREFEAAARKEEDAGKKAEIAAQAHREAIGELDLSEAIDSDAAYRELQESTREHTALVERQRAAGKAGDRATEAQRKLQEAKDAYHGPSVAVATIARDQARDSLGAHQDRLRELEQQVEEAHDAVNAARREHERASEVCVTAEQHFNAMTAWQDTLEAEVPSPPDPSELSAAGTRLEEARAVVGRLPAYEQAKRHRATAIEADREAAAHSAASQRLRDIAKGTDGVLSEIVGKLGTPLRVQAGRLVLDTARGETYFHELSHGERWRLGLDIAVAVAGDRTLFTIPQEAWDSLDPQNRAEIGQHVREKGITVLTAEATGDDRVRAEVYDQAAAREEAV